MAQTRMARHARVKNSRKRLAAVLATVALVVVAGVAVALARQATAKSPAVASDAASEATASLMAQESTATTAAPQATAQIVEVPDVRGKTLAEAEMVMTLAGFSVERQADATATPDPDRRVLAQQPAPGVKLESGATVVLVHAAKPAKKAPAPAATQYVVVLDPGHQRRSNNTPEPIGPGSAETKAKVTGGAQGVSTKIPEYEFVLQLSNKVKQRLEARGVKVVMTRTKHDVDISNAERAQVGNGAGADLAVRVHADSNVDRDIRGASTLFPAANQWTKPFVQRSESAARKVQTAVVAATGASDRGVKERGDLTGFNWSKIPVILVEAGFLSNAAEDELLATPAYQDKLADGIADGVMAYLKG